MNTIVKREMIFDNIKVESKEKTEAIRIISHLLCQKEYGLRIETD